MGSIRVAKQMRGRRQAVSFPRGAFPLVIALMSGCATQEAFRAFRYTAATPELVQTQSVASARSFGEPTITDAPSAAVLTPTPMFQAPAPTPPGAPPVVSWSTPTAPSAGPSAAGSPPA